MRLGLVLDAPAGAALYSEAGAADRFGLDLVWIPETDRGGVVRSSTVVAATLTAHAPSVRVVVEASARRHPLELAEELAVTDQLLGGRLGLACTGAPDELDETVRVLGPALASRPFRHAGLRWTLPALDEEGPQGMVLVTPAPAQIELPIWLYGAGLLALARDHSLPVVGSEGDDGVTMERHWQDVEGGRGNAATRQPRAALRSLAVPTTPDGDVGAIVAALEAEQDAWGMDLAVVRLTPGLSPGERLGAIEVLATRVRPRLQAIDLPDELVASWSPPRPSESESALP